MIKAIVGFYLIVAVIWFVAGCLVDKKSTDRNRFGPGLICRSAMLWPFHLVGTIVMEIIELPIRFVNWVYKKIVGDEL